MLNLREVIERKARILAKSPQAKKTLQRYFEDPDIVDQDIVYNQFKMVSMG